MEVTNLSQLKAIKAEMNVLSRSDGSVIITQGKKHEVSAN